MHISPSTPYKSMASMFLQSPSLITTSRLRCRKLLLLAPRIHFPFVEKSHSLRTFHIPAYPQTCVTADNTLTTTENDKSLQLSDKKPVKLLFWILLWASLSLGLHALSGNAIAAAVDSIRTSSIGVKVANSLQALGWPDEAVVVALATLPVIELRGAIPVGYWLQLNPLKLTVLSIIGNMIPVPLIILYVKKVAILVTGKNKGGLRLVNMLFENAKAKAGPVKEFQWLGLMLFVAVPFPGTGAWTGAFIASILDMPFWSGVSANFVGVVLAGLLVNLLVNLGLKYAILTGFILFLISTFMWSILRYLKNCTSI